MEGDTLHMDTVYVVENGVRFVSRETRVNPGNEKHQILWDTK